MWVRTAIRLGRSSSSAASIAAAIASRSLPSATRCGMPAICVEPRRDVLAERPSRSARRAGCGCRRRASSACRAGGGRPGDAASDAIPSWRSPSEQITNVRWSTIAWPGRLNSRGQATLGDGHPDRVRDALAERAGRRLDPGRQAVLRVTGRPRAPLAEPLELVERQVVAGQVEQRVEEHRGVAGAQDEPVAVRPVGSGRGVTQEPRPQRRRPSARRPSARRDGPSWPSARRRSTGSGWCRWRGGRAGRWRSSSQVGWVPPS